MTVPRMSIVLIADACPTEPVGWPWIQNFTSDVLGGSVVNPTMTRFARSESTNRMLIAGAPGSCRIGGDPDGNVAGRPCGQPGRDGLIRQMSKTGNWSMPPTSPGSTGGWDSAGRSTVRSPGSRPARVGPPDPEGDGSTDGL